MCTGSELNLAASSACNGLLGSWPRRPPAGSPFDEGAKADRDRRPGVERGAQGVEIGAPVPKSSVEEGQRARPGSAAMIHSEAACERQSWPPCLVDPAPACLRLPPTPKVAAPVMVIGDREHLRGSAAQL
jgi:hypothetical protein